MCGRYVLNAPEDLSERFQLRQLTINLPRTYNAAPSEMLPAIFPQDGERVAELMQWGLIPRWRKPGEKDNFAPINARAETILEKPMFRNLVARRRCLVPANGFYEWQRREDRKQPYFISVTDDPTFAFAGLYDMHKEDDGGDLIGSYTILTTSANKLMESIHDRMPVILRKEDEEEWLSPEVTDPVAIQHLLQPYPAKEMEAYPISTAVNNVRNDGEELIKPLEK
ncbi:MAG: SOS response-associated peptidase [Thermomicrobiales bacterium]|jgi:putative SOS response-associated peptidase YedK